MSSRIIWCRPLEHWSRLPVTSYAEHKEHIKAMSDLREQIALVTGAGSPTGIGFASARLLGGAGASLVLVSTTDRIHLRADELEKEGIHAKGCVADLTRPELVQEIVDDIVKMHGRL